MKTINYTAKVLPDGHISLPYKIKEAMGLAVDSVVKEMQYNWPVH